MNTPPVDRLGGHPVSFVHEEGPTVVVLVHAGKLALVIKYVVLVQYQILTIFIDT